MSREIKFRAWDKRGKKYLNNAQNIWMNNTCFGDLLASPNFEIEQYTGLKDKNGKEIYEGDIVQFPILGKPHRGIIAWSDIDSAFIVGMMYLSRFQPKMEVLGNVHTNPGLLEEDK